MTGVHVPAELVLSRWPEDGQVRLIDSSLSDIASRTWRSGARACWGARGGGTVGTRRLVDGRAVARAVANPKASRQASAIACQLQSGHVSPGALSIHPVAIRSCGAAVCSSGPRSG